MSESFDFPERITLDQGHFTGYAAPREAYGEMVEYVRADAGVNALEVVYIPLHEILKKLNCLSIDAEWHEGRIQYTVYDTRTVEYGVGKTAGEALGMYIDSLIENIRSERKVGDE
jgi:hypothetical protein